MPIKFIPGPSDFRPPPYSFENIQNVTFKLKSNDKSKLQTICDDFLNKPLGRTGQDTFVPWDDTVLLTFSSFPDAESETNPVIGSLTYQEVSLVFEVMDGKNGNQPYWFAALLFLDGPQAGAAEYFATPPILLGRELFGLPKIRGEIDFHPDLTGTLRCTFPTPQNVLMSLDVCIKVSLKEEMQLAPVMEELEEVETIVIEKPSDVRAKRRVKDLLARRKVINRRLNDIRHGEIFGEKFHPFEVVNKLWGDAVLTNMRDIHPEIRAALEKVKGSWDAQELVHAVELGVSTGFFEYLSMSDTTLGCPLMGVRQIHSPTNFDDADHQLIIVAPFQYDDIPIPAENDYVVEFFSTELMCWLGLDPLYNVSGANALCFNGANADYGKTVSTVTS